MKWGIGLWFALIALAILFWLMCLLPRSQKGRGFYGDSCSGEVRGTFLAVCSHTPSETNCLQVQWSVQSFIGLLVGAGGLDGETDFAVLVSATESRACPSLYDVCRLLPPALFSRCEDLGGEFSEKVIEPIF